MKPKNGGFDKDKNSNTRIIVWLFDYGLSNRILFFNESVYINEIKE